MKKTIEKDSGITIDNVILKFFNEKSDFIKKVNFSIDNDLQYFPPKNHFLYRKNDIQENLVVKKIFSQQCRAVVNFTPPHSVAEKSSKSAKIIPMGTLTKTRKTRLSIAKRQNGKTSEKNVPMGISTKMFKNLGDV